MEHNILTDIIKFTKNIKHSELNLELFQNKEDYIKRIESYLGTNRIQTIIFAAVFEMNANNEQPEISSLSKYLKCSTIELLAYKSVIEQMFAKGYFKTGYFEVITQDNCKGEFVINQELEKAILSNNQFQLKPPEPLSSIQICFEIEKQVNNCRTNSLNMIKLIYAFETLCFNYENNELIKFLENYKFNCIDSISLIYIIANNLNGNDETLLSYFSKAVNSNPTFRLIFEQNIIKKKWAPIKVGLLDIQGEFSSSSTVSLTQKACKKLNSISVPVKLKDGLSTDKLLQPNAIIKKRLYYNNFTDEEIQNITSSLRPNKYKQIVKSLKSEGFSSGICTLFYGAPGTGKTESVYQIAKATNRAVWKVDLSELKSMWYGESQKLVKAMFTNYKQLCEKEKQTPILLLNEADAILGKRNANAQQSSDKTENAIQNIFLDCLEDLEGILFATTNLEGSLDKAFERRFLFKVFFGRPDKNTRLKIWKAKLNNVKSSTLKNVSNYEFSGGEIDNIARKYEMAYILNSKINQDEILMKLCETEKISTLKVSSKIGFL